MLPLNKLLSGYTISDEVINRTSSTAIALAHSTIKSAGLEIWTGAGKTGTKLTLATDYSLSDLNAAYTAEAGENIYTKLAIVNGAYQSMNLYVTYYSVGDFAAVEKMGQAAMETINATASFTLYASAPTTRKRIVNTGASAITVTANSGTTIEGQATMTLSAGHEVELELIGTDWRKVVLSQSATPEAGKAMVWGSVVTPELIPTIGYFNNPSGSFKVKQIGEQIFLKCEYGFDARTITSGDVLFGGSGLVNNTGIAFTIRLLTTAESTVRQVLGVDITVGTDSGFAISAYCKSGQAVSGGNITGVNGIYGDASAYIM